VNFALLQRWRLLAGEGADELGDALIRAWREPHRVYHDQSHLIWLLDEADRRRALIGDPLFVGYAIWFHDAIYRIGGKETDGAVYPDNETRSANWAREAIPDKALAERVGRVIEMTKQHHKGRADGDAALFLDMDIAILGQSWETYCAYASAIRREFSAYNDGAFAAGRGRFLETQLERARTFRTDVYEHELGDAARANMRWEAEEMRRGRMVKS
jgi:predicted metal-dependent HD superfamily phosphohydrolase